MNKQALDRFWDQFRQKYGVYLRLLEAIPADGYRSLPVPGLRSAAELAIHVSGTCVRDCCHYLAAQRTIVVDSPGRSLSCTPLEQCRRQASDSRSLPAPLPSPSS